MNKNRETTKKRRFAILSVASVLFGWHAGGGFATGNQAHQFYVISGWWGPLSAVLAILLLTLTVRQAMTMYNARGLTNYKELFQTLYHPLDKLEWVFEVYFLIMTLMATSASIAGAGALFQDVMRVPYGLSVAVVGGILLVLTIFGADLMRKVSTVMSALILVCSLSIFVIGIASHTPEIAQVFRQGPSLEELPAALLRSFQYAGFQSASIPSMVVCGTVLLSSRECGRSMWLSFVMNSLALCLSVLMLLGWQGYYTGVEGGVTIPTLTVCKALGLGGLAWAYYICLFLCFISTGKTSVFGFTERFEKARVLAGIRSETLRRCLVALLVMAVSLSISLAGLSAIVKYGYGYCGYVGIAIIVVPFLTVGVYKNRKFRGTRPEKG